MHSSRMRTVRCRSCLLGVGGRGGCLPSLSRGVSAQGGCLPGGCLPRGMVSAQGVVSAHRGGGWCLSGGVVSAQGGQVSAQRGVCLVCPGGCLPSLFLWTEFLTHACENITFPQLRLRTVITQTYQQWTEEELESTCRGLSPSQVEE